MTVNAALKMICDHRAKVKRHRDDWHDGYYDGLTAALMMLSEDEPADTDKPIWEAKDKMTLKELARALRKIFDFGYLTVCEYSIALFRIDDKPWFEGTWEGRFDRIGTLCIWACANALDLSEYKDENGNIDYSKCIVEVAE